MSDLSVIAIAEAVPGFSARIEEAIIPCIRSTLMEPGCLQYEVHRDRAVDGRFVFVERWKSEGALDAHKQTTHFETMVREMTPYLERPLEILLLDGLSSAEVPTATV